MPILDKAYGTAYHFTHSREEAEDVVQEAAIAAFRSFHTFQPGTNFKAWFLTILVNCARRHYRNRKREPEITSLDDAPELYLYLQTARTEAQGKDNNPAVLLIRKMTEQQIHAAIAALPDEYRVVCVLYFMEELAYQEIASILDCPVGTVRSRLHRGRKLLQKALYQLTCESPKDGMQKGSLQ